MTNLKKSEVLTEWKKLSREEKDGLTFSEIMSFYAVIYPAYASRLIACAVLYGSKGKAKTAYHCVGIVWFMLRKYRNMGMGFMEALETVEFSQVDNARKQAVKTPLMRDVSRIELYNQCETENEYIEKYSQLRNAENADYIGIIQKKETSIDIDRIHDNVFIAEWEKTLSNNDYFIFHKYIGIVSSGKKVFQNTRLYRQVEYIIFKGFNTKKVDKFIDYYLTLKSA